MLATLMLRRTLLRQATALATRAPSAVRALSSTPLWLKSDDLGGRPNDGSHRTVYDDFYNILQDQSTLEVGQPKVTISSMSETGFTLNDGLVLSSPIVVLTGQVYMWDAPKLDPMGAMPSGFGWEKWAKPSQEKDMAKKFKNAQTKEELWRVFELVDDRPEILIFGTGKTVLPPPAHIRKYINSLGIQLDVQNTRHACSTFNLLSEEGRKVAVAALPNQRTPIQKLTPDQLHHK